MKAIIFYSGCGNRPPKPIRSRGVSFMLTYHDLTTKRGKRFIRRFARKRGKK